MQEEATGNAEPHGLPEPFLPSPSVLAAPSGAGVEDQGGWSFGGDKSVPGLTAIAAANCNAPTPLCVYFTVDQIVQSGKEVWV